MNAPILPRASSVIRPLVASILVATIISGVIAWKLIFAIPAIFSAALAVCLVLAYVACGAN